MKKFTVILAVLCLTVAGFAIVSRADTSNPSAPAAAAKPPANYRIHVDWHGAQGETNSLEVLTTEGQVELDTLQKNSVKINNNDIPVTLKLNATLKVLDEQKGQLQIFLGRTVPYVTSTNPMGSSSYSQMSVGLQSSFIVTFGKPDVIQSDEYGTITVLVTRLDE